MRGVSQVLTVLALFLGLAPLAAADEGSHDGVASPTRVLLIGDSNIYGQLGIALERDLRDEGYEVHRRGKPTSGLARPDFFDWPQEAEELLSRVDPHVVIMMVGGNDGQRLRSRDGDERQIWWRRDAAWRERYKQRVIELVAMLRGDDRHVFLLSPTNRRPAGARARMVRVREVQQAAAAEVDRVTWIDMFPLSSDERGRWLGRGIDAAGRRVRFRRGDGIHLTPAGGEEVVRRLRPELRAAGLP